VKKEAGNLKLQENKDCAVMLTRAIVEYEESSLSESETEKKVLFEMETNCEEIYLCHYEKNIIKIKDYFPPHRRKDRERE
jgi:hypothetical protein